MTRSQTCRMGTFVFTAFAALAGCGSDFHTVGTTSVNGSAGSGTGGAADTASTSGGGGFGTGAGGAGGATAATSSSDTATTGVGAGGGGGAVIDPTTLLVVDQHDAPRAGVAVVVNDAAGAVVTSGVTGVSGDALVTVPEGGSVSIFWSIELAFHVDSVLDVPPGGVVRFTTQGPEVPPPPPPASTTYKIVAQGQPAGVASLKFLATCDSSSTNGVSAVLNNSACAADATQDFLVLALASDQTPVAWGALLDQPTNPGALFDFVVQVDKTTFATMDAQVINVPSTASYGYITVGPSHADDIGVATVTSTTAPFPAFGMVTSVPAGMTSSYNVNESASWSVGASSVWVGRSRRYDSLPAVSTFDASRLALVSVQPTDLADAVHPKFGWAHSDGALGNLGELTAAWTSGASYTLYKARFAPDRASPIRIPDIPPALAAYAPSAQSTLEGAAVSYADEEAESSYADVLDGVATASGLGTAWSIGSMIEW